MRSLSLLSVFVAVAHGYGYHQNPYDQWRDTSKRDGLVVDLGFERYVGQTVDGLSSWKGLRYGAAPVGEHRFQAPRVPAENRTDIRPASGWAEMCLQDLGAFGILGSEDCLFVNIHAPENAKDLPVFVYIHGGAYQAGSGRTDPTDFIGNNDNRFITVFIQYRLGVFGWMSSDEMNRHGQLNAGLLDMELALQWVQAYAHLFGGDPRRVTIGGESAGGGAVMQLGLLRGGHLGESLYSQGIGASPWLPNQFRYNADVPTGYYNSIVSAMNCTPKSKHHHHPSSFHCLVAANGHDLATAGAKVDSDAAMYNWGFSPVVDGKLLQDIPSRQLKRRRVNGRRVLVGNNANDGATFVPTDIATHDDFETYIHKQFPSFTSRDLRLLRKTYPTFGDTDPNIFNYSTSGDGRVNALSLGSWANGEQQRAFNLRAEALFDCPSYWLAEAYEQGWKYEFAVAPSLHAFDVGAYFFSNQTHPDFTDDFVMAFQNIWGNFIAKGDPRISHDLACGTNCTKSTGTEKWRPYSRSHPVHLSANITGGHLGQYNLWGLIAPNVVGPGLQNEFRVANAHTWEGGRGHRCDFWRDVGSRVPG